MTAEELAAIVTTSCACSCPTCGMDNRSRCLDGAVHATRIYRAHLAGLVADDAMAYVIRQFPYGVVTPERAA